MARGEKEGEGTDSLAEYSSGYSISGSPVTRRQTPREELSESSVDAEKGWFWMNLVSLGKVEYSGGLT